MKIINIILSLLAIGCSHKKLPEDVTSPDQFSAVQSRAVDLSDHGWIVSRGPNDSAEHIGDSLLWTSIAVGTMDCTEGEPEALALEKMLNDTDGGLYRHPDMPNDWSIDGAIGLYWGISHRVARCDDQEVWAPLFSKHISKVSLPPDFDVMRNTVAAELGIGAAPSVTDRGSLGAEMVTWAIGTVSQRAAAYRLHLAFLVLDVVDAPKSKSAYCAAVVDAQIPLVQHFCGVTGLSDWLQNFVYNTWEYRHQRAAWENPDGNGLETPGVDFLIGYREQLINR